eukprot:TRINITY_DN3694_c0_g1_i3.p2 TRINITY_DN3694_c0_g1~~TRINITY_DN3694_c0_g1_i3.p2  ORF type:complete len:272 (+),score=40.99 TRINITY_DN3694_c0_g1_i3:93-908(+)
MALMTTFLPSACFPGSVTLSSRVQPSSVGLGANPSISLAVCCEGRSYQLNSLVIGVPDKRARDSRPSSLSSICSAVAMGSESAATSGTAVEGEVLSKGEDTDETVTNGHASTPTDDMQGGNGGPITSARTLALSTEILGHKNEWDPFGAMGTPLYQTATFKQPGATENGPYDYTRSGNPTRDSLESLLAKVEGAKRAFAFSTGMAALAAVTKLVEAGQEILAGDDIYGGTDRLLSRVVPKNGVSVRCRCLFGARFHLHGLTSADSKVFRVF